MGLFDYLHAHPVWGLIYLLIVCFAAVLSVASLIPRKSSPPFQVEDRTGWPKG